MFDTQEDLWVICTDGHKVVHFVHNTEGCQTTSGQPLVLYSKDKQVLVDLFFQEYAENEDGSEDWVMVPFDWSVGYTQPQAQQIVDLVASCNDFVRIAWIKHPSKDEYAVPVQQRVFAALPAGPVKDMLLQAAQLSIGYGTRRTTEQMREQGWFE